MKDMTDSVHWGDVGLWDVSVDAMYRMTWFRPCTVCTLDKTWYSSSERIALWQQTLAN
jgi:hypothetical protein